MPLTSSRRCWQAFAAGRSARRLISRIQLHLSQPDRIGVTAPVDFALAFWMMHEVRSPGSFLAELYALLKPGGCLLLVEPRIHVSGRLFASEVEAAVAQGFHAGPGPDVRFSRSVLLNKVE